MRITCILLTAYFQNAVDFHEWCQHHFSVGIDHIHVFDNDTIFDLRQECSVYGHNISYEHVSNPQQYQLYNTYINNCKTDYVMPIDDDEFLWISQELGTLQNAIEYYENKYGNFNVLGIRWLYKFPKVFHTERTCSVLEYCTEENDYLATRFSGHGNNTIKCIVKRDSFIKYIDADDSTVRNHIPITTGRDMAMLCDGSMTKKQIVSSHIDDEKIRLIHCPYKGYSEYLAKQCNHLSVSHKVQRQRHYDAFNYILDRID